MAFIVQTRDRRSTRSTCNPDAAGQRVLAVAVEIVAEPPVRAGDLRILQIDDVRVHAAVLEGDFQPARIRGCCRSSAGASTETMLLTPALNGSIDADEQILQRAAGDAMADDGRRARQVQRS